MGDVVEHSAGCLTYLRADVLRHVVHLKMLAAYGPAMRCVHARKGGQEGALLDRVPAERDLVFKLIDDASRQEVEQRFRVQRVNAFLSYTAAPGDAFAWSPEVTVSEGVDEHCLPLYAANGYDEAEMHAYERAGPCRSCAMSAIGRSRPALPFPISVCCGRLGACIPCRKRDAEGMPGRS